ncbi:MAG: hypothetical protein E6J90_26740 [Deltaproteobacteria bacterium]|nr:MAG: hypothetical protein E6J91_18510 [Deltaproteobacteria bacterium]TMQ14576.1 MAG: hypothetical protein E6J90_26740 [Deltaproteobacteria bacterium]
MAAWRVRKLKKLGAPEIVYGLDGLPLFLPMDADIEDVRHQSGGETGRFRLDPVDDHNKSIPSAPASYVCVHPIAPAPAAPAAPAVPAASASAETTSQLISALLESQKQHTELARMYVSQFAVVANAMAGVVRSAGDAGLTARVPLVVPAMPEARPAEASDPDRETDEDESDEDESDEQEAVEVAAKPEEHSWARVGQSFVDHVGPYVGPMLASSPGLARLLGAHGRKPKTDATTPGPGPSDPAPVGGDASPPSGPVPGVDAAMLVRLQQIMAQLTPEEEEFARSLIDEIPPGDMASWINRLRAMSIPAAVAYVRTMFREARAAAGDAPPARPTAPAAPTAPRRAGHPAGESGSSESTAPRRATSNTSPTRRPVPATQTSDGQALRDAGTQAHLDRIERALSADERPAMRKHFAALSPSERSLFVATLLMLPVADAVAVVRGQVGPHPSTPTPTSPASGDAPPTEATIAPGEVSPNRTASTPARKRPQVTAPTAAAPDVTRLAPHEPASPATDAAPDAIAASGAAPSVAPSDASAAVERTADTHLAEIEGTLAPEERMVVHTLVSELSPDDCDAWLHKLLSGSVADGAAMLRAAIQAATAEPPTGKATTSDPRHESATVSVAQVAVTSDESEAGHEPDGGDDDSDGDELDEGEEPDGGDEMDDCDDLDDCDEMESSDKPAAHEEPDPSATPPNRPDAPLPPATVPTPAIATRAVLPTLDADSVAHFQAIDDALTLAEKMRAHELAAQRPAAELRRWYAELVELSVPEAVAKIRAELARSDSDSQSTKKGGVS